MSTSTVIALTAHDRCDRCGAPATVRAELSGFGELLFCQHHFRKHADRLKEIASSIQEAAKETESPTLFD